MYRLGLVILIFAVGLSGCGDVDPVSSPATSAVTPSSPTADTGPPTSATSSTTTPPPPPTTTAPPTTTTIADPGALDRSVLVLGLGNETAGRFELIPNAASRLSRTQGSYWAMDDGNVFTRFDLDPGVIGAEAGRLAERLSTDYPDLAGTSLLSALSDHDPDVEFQVGITDAIRWYDRRVPSLEMLEQASVVLEAGVFVESVPPDCRRNLTAYETAARAWVWDLDPEIEAGTTWAFPVPDYDSALATHRSDLHACEEPMAEQMSESPPEIQFRVTARGDATAVEVLADDGLYSDHDPTPVFTVTMQPDAQVGEIPEPRDPEPLLGFTSTYLAAVGACGELPWAHTEMAGGDSWVDPDEEPLIGFTFLADRLLCAGDVPEEAISR